MQRRGFGRLPQPQQDHRPGGPVPGQARVRVALQEAAEGRGGKGFVVSAQGGQQGVLQQQGILGPEVHGHREAGQGLSAGFRVLDQARRGEVVEVGQVRRPPQPASDLPQPGNPVPAAVEQARQLPALRQRQARQRRRQERRPGFLPPVQGE